MTTQVEIRNAILAGIAGAGVSLLVPNSTILQLGASIAVGNFIESKLENEFRDSYTTNYGSAMIIGKKALVATGVSLFIYYVTGGTISTPVVLGTFGAEALTEYAIMYMKMNSMPPPGLRDFNS